MRLQQVRKLVENTADPAYAVDRAGCIAAWNSAAEAMFTLASRDAIGRPCHEIINGADECGPVCSADCAVGQALGKHDPVGNFDMQIQTANGMQWCNVSVLIADGENSATRYSIHIVRPNDFRKRLDMLVRELVVRDFAVTGTGLPGAQPTTPISLTRSPVRETNLSVRECEVLRLLAKSVSTAAIGAQLQISRTTVNNHVQHILRKLDSHTRLEAIRRAERAGLI